MIIALLTLILASVFFLVLATLTQVLYLETLRLRTRELPSLEYFKETLEERIGLKADNGALAFSVIKHSMLAFLGIFFLSLTSNSAGLSVQTLLEAAVFSWLTMMATAYVIPQLLYRHTACRWMAVLVPILIGMTILVRPITALLKFVQSLMQLGDEDQTAVEGSTPAENLEALISAGTEEGIIEEEDRKLIQSAVAFGSKTVREVMTPRPDIVSIAADATLEDLRQLVIHEQFSRIPVYQGSIDHITGFVHVRDMFELENAERAMQKVSNVTRPIRLVPETKPVNDLLREMQQDGAHMAVVIDEYGNTAGLATMEDMVEEIVGEIRDEHEPTLDVEKDQEGRFTVSGSFDVDHLHDLLEFRPEEQPESTTIGGLVTEWLGRVPQPGEHVERDGIRIEVLAANALRVEQVRLSKLESPAHE
ncbi:MAG TPA: hemolysin family protein [Bryobacteraceae bacterium]|nr:hemolysin family protein [Bryobacteraceae bacterium]